MKSAKSAYSLSTNLASQYTERVYKNKKPALRINTETSQRIKSAQIGSSSRKCYTNTSRTIENQTQSKIPLQIYQRYIEESFMSNNHDKIVKEAKLVAPTVINHLNINFYETQQLSHGMSLYDKHPNLLFKMYETLINLDKNVIQELFLYEALTDKDQIGIKEKKERNITDNFRFDFFIKAINIMDDFITTLIKIIDDKTLAVFIEQLWKFWVVLLDLNTQWSQTRYKALLDIQVGAVESQLKDCQFSLDALREKYIQKVKGHQLRVAVEQKKNLHLKEENLKWLQMYSELETKLEELKNLENAEGEIRKINLDLKEMDFQFNVFQKNMNDQQKQVSTSVKNLASLLKRKDQKSFTEFTYEELNLLDYPGFNDDYLLVNPIIFLLQIRAKDQKTTPSDFLSFLVQYIHSNPNMSGPELFMQFIEIDFNKAHFLKDLIKTTDDDIINITKLILGIGKSNPVSHVVILEAIKLCRAIENQYKHFDQSQNATVNKRTSIILNQEKSVGHNIDLTQEIPIAGSEVTLGQQLYEQILQVSTTTIKLSKIMYIAIQFYAEKEYSKWMSCCYLWQQGTMKIESRWDQQEQFLNMDSFLVWQFVNLKYKNQKSQDQPTLDQCFNWVYKIWLLRPKIFIKPTADPIETQRSSNTIQKPQEKLSIPYKKSITLIDSQRKK
ncbi:unnamed protein product (macronuclear) [Paramecium tetraurelia]|uniref:Uncharacterized protein n=1 Tax=Paramecium tetraurelia TaxID=5888 RepID=A0CBF0_PARTE|nr:uncharacterized protein GSPATT00036900001 [Paramecium tetraurelia]CAK68117.1 unnamed protein product [Paramecium tetraurelia]|eukprot:XP_001435514.1 hypothetical protein (macronuclear) [Paramecium tetraurelia strain d4-2]